MMNTAQITKLAIAALEDTKGIDIQVIDVTSLTSVTDHLVICTGTSSRHVRALASAVMDRAYEMGIRPLSGQGLEQGDWALVDLNGVVVHVMQLSARASYQLEKLWDLGQAKPLLEEPKKAKPKAKPKAKVAVKKAPEKPKAKAKPAKITKAKPAAKGKLVKGVKVMKAVEAKASRAPAPAKRAPSKKK